MRIESNKPFWACVCPCAHAYALVKTRLFLKETLKYTGKILNKIGCLLNDKVSCGYDPEQKLQQLQF